jgi:5-methylcytosine-specific restriction endonuclease McrA
MNLIEHIKHRIQGKIPAGSKRSDRWPSVRKAHLEKFPNCAVCGGTAKIEVHHIEVFHLNPGKELDPTNLITLCEGVGTWNHHLWVGHLGNFKSFNEKVEFDSSVWKQKIKERP